MNLPEVSVIVPAYNAQKTIGQVVEALLCQDYSSGYEIIVVDDGSTDDTKSIVKAYDKVILVAQENAGPAQARNHGARVAKGRFLAFTDSDCLAHRDWLSLLMACFNQDNIAVVAGSYGIANPESRLARGVHQEIMFRHALLMPNFPKAFGSYNFCVRKEVFEQVGGFNESYRHASGEDNDLSYKILKSGGRIYFERKALVDHYHPTRVWRYLKEQYRHGVWRVKMYQEHPQMIQGDNYTYWKDIVEIPWVGVCVLGLFLSALEYQAFALFTGLAFVSFLVFEYCTAYMMMKPFFDFIFYGNILFFRSFARALGFSTGIFQFFVFKVEKKIK